MTPPIWDDPRVRRYFRGALALVRRLDVDRQRSGPLPNAATDRLIWHALQAQADPVDDGRPPSNGDLIGTARR